MAGWTTTELLERVRRLARLADEEADFTDAVLLLAADDMLRTRFSEVVASLRQSYWVHTLDVALAAGQTEVALPARALGDSVLDVTLLDAGGSPQALHGPLPLGSTDSRDEAGFAVEGGVLRLGRNLSGTVRIRYELRRPRLVLPAAAAQITAVSRTTRTLTLAASWAALYGFPRVDLVSASPALSTLAIDLLPASVGGGATSVQFSVDLPLQIAVGDWVALAGESPVVPLPDVLWPAYVNAIAADLLSQIGDTQGAQQRQALSDRDLASAVALLTPRIKHRPEVLLPTGLCRRGGL